MKEQMYAPSDIIFNKGETDNRIYFIYKGKIETFIETRKE
jgi:hypothetical protein